MTDSDKTAAARRRRGSMLAAVQPEPAAPMKAVDGTIDFFKFRVAAQQFMNENGPLFAAFARAADAPNGLIDHGSLAKAVAASTELAIAVARRFTGKAEPGPQEVRPFRHAAAEIVALAWKEKGLVGFDVERIAAEHAEAFDIVDEELDRATFKDLDLSDEASLAITSASVTLALMRPVMVYDFRRDRRELVSGMASAVMALAAEAASQVLPDNCRSDDRRTVLQTSANRLADIMAAVYDRKARQVVAHIGALDETEKEAFARRYDPLPEVTRTFREWGVVFAATTLAFARGAVNAAKVPEAAAPRT